ATAAGSLEGPPAHAAKRAVRARHRRRGIMACFAVASDTSDPELRGSGGAPPDRGRARRAAFRGAPAVMGARPAGSPFHEVRDATSLRLDLSGARGTRDAGVRAGREAG